MSAFESSGDRLNPVALITGAASGIGALTAQRLAARATGGLILIDIDEDALSDVADALENPPERVSTLAFDVTDPERWRQANGFITDHYGRLDWAVINADAAHAQLITDADIDDWRNILPINLDGAFLSVKSVLPQMRTNAAGGAVVITSTSAGLKGETRTASHGASMAGLLQLMRTTAREGALFGIRANAVIPDGVDAPTWRNAPLLQDMARELGGERAAFEALMTLTTPIARYSETDDVARLIDLLLNDAASLTGATLVVDAGYTL